MRGMGEDWDRPWKRRPTRPLQAPERHRRRPSYKKTFVQKRRRVYLWRRLGALLTIIVLVPAIAAAVASVPLFGSVPEPGEPNGGQPDIVLPAKDSPGAVDKEAASPEKATPERIGAENAGADKPDSDETSESVQAAGGDTLDVLILGVDKRPEGSFVEGSRADTIMVARVFPESEQIRLLSIPRDLFVEIEPGVHDRINAAYAYDGVPGIAEVLEGQFGISVDQHAVVDFEGFEEIIDTLGGVTLDVGSELPPGWRMGEGVQTLDGRHALLYARYRDTPGGDLDRIARQQQLVAALHEQALGWGTLPRLPKIAAATDDAVESDVSTTEAISLARPLATRNKDSMTSAQLEGIPSVLPDGRHVLLPEEKKNQLILEDFNAQ